MSKKNKIPYLDIADEVFGLLGFVSIFVIAYFVFFGTFFSYAQTAIFMGESGNFSPEQSINFMKRLYFLMYSLLGIWVVSSWFHFCYPMTSKFHGLPKIWSPNMGTLR